MTRLAVLVLPALISSGCFIYEGDDDCEFGGAADYLVVELRNPYSGLCEAGGGGGGGGPCDPGYEDEAPTVPEDWAQCWGGCEGLDEQTCLATPACRAAYTSDCLEWQDCTTENYTFYGCWGTAPSGAIQGECAGLDAYQCSRHDDCIARHWAGSSGCGGTGNGDCAPIADPSLIGNFQSCQPEPTAQQGCYEDWECPSGQTCNSEELCLPGPYGCGAAGGESDSAGAVPCDDRCYGYCVPTTVDPGNCYEPTLCDSIGPTCPEGTLPGVSNGCWTGYCIPLAECPDQPPACETLGEEACLASGNCQPQYEGINCQMMDGVWVCESYVFTYCTGATDSP